MVLAQITGDPSVIDRFGSRISHVPDPPERAGVTDPGTAGGAGGRGDRCAGYAAPRSDQDRRRSGVLRSAAAGGAGVRRRPRAGATPAGAGSCAPLPTLPRTVPIPDTMTVAIIGAGIAGINAALAAAEAGVSYELFDRNTEVGGTWLTTTYPGIGVDTPSAYYSLSREVNPGLDQLLPAGHRVPGLSRRIGRQTPAS